MSNSDRVNRLLNHLTAGVDVGSGTESITLTPSVVSGVGQWRTTDINRVNGIDDYVSLLPSEVKTNLSSEQLRQYEEEGYFVVKGLISTDDANKYTQHFLKICRGEVDKQDMLVMRDIVLAKQNKDKNIKGQEEVTKIQDWQNDEVLMQYVRDPKVLKYVQGVIGENVRSIHTMLINKPPDLGKGTSEHPMHQDLLYFPFRPANRIIAAWTALQTITPENGCLTVIPGSHKLGLKPHNPPDALGNMAYQGVRQDLVSHYTKDLGYEKIELIMEPGDTVFFHPNLVHGSGPNLSTKFRKAISCHYASGLCKFSEIPDHNYGLIDELLDTLGRKLGLDGKKWSKAQKLEAYSLTWKLKSRQIAGKEPEAWKPEPLSFMPH